MIRHDLRQAWRALLRRPGLSFSILIILALGIGSTTTILSIASSVLLGELPYKDGNRLVVIKMRLETDGSASPISYLDVLSWREQSRTLQQISINANNQELNLTGGDRAERVEAGFVSASYFDLLGIRPARGRSFRPEEDDRLHPKAVAVLSHGVWQRRFGGDPAILGKGVQIQGLPFQVIGILPKGFRDVYQNLDVYIPVTLSRLTQREGYVEDRRVRWLAAFARLRPGVGVEQASQELRSISARLETTFPNTNQGYRASVQPLRTYQFDFDRMRLSMLILLVGAALVLLIGCTNVVNLLLVRAVERRKEVALRLALGVTRFRLIRQFVLEGAILCLGGALLGVGTAFFAVRLLDDIGNHAFNLPDFLRFSVDLRALGAVVALSILISFLSGLIPARASLKVNLQEELQAENKGQSHSSGMAFTRSALVVSAVFFAVVLLIGAGLVSKSLYALARSDPGFRVDHVLSARFELPVNEYRTEEPVYRLYRQILARAHAIPGVEDAGLWAPGMIGAAIFAQFLVPEGHSLEAPEDKVRVYEHRMSPHLLGKLRFTFLAGRDFTEEDQVGRPRVAILSHSLAEAMWPSQSPLGKRFWVGAPHNVWFEVVGVVADVDQRGRLMAEFSFRHDVYFPLFQMRARTTSILLTFRGDGGKAREQLSDVLRTIAPNIPIYDVQTLQERRRDEEAGGRLNALLLIFFASSALGLAIIGIYSVLVYSVRRQSFEIGVRMALGAHPSDLLRLLTWRGMALLGLGLLAGLACAFGLAKGLSSLLFDVNPHDPLVFLVVPGIIALVSLPAILGPAYKATRGEPSSLFRLH